MKGHAEKNSTPYPLPAGAPQGCCAKGQTVPPINRHNQGKISPMTRRIEKSVFISYRHTNVLWAKYMR